MTDNTKPLLVIALEAEDQGLLSGQGYDIIYCGVGKINASYSLTKALQTSRRYSSVLNLGLAGSHRFLAGSVVEASAFVQRDMDATGLGFTLGETPFDAMPPILEIARRFTQLPHGICASGDSFLQSKDVSWDIIDMEAYALAKVCQREGVAFNSVKYVTDGADGFALTDWAKNLEDAAKAFVTLLT